MKFKHIPSGEILNPNQVRKKFGSPRSETDRAITIFPKDLSKWDDVLLKQLKLERIK